MNLAPSNQRATLAQMAVRSATFAALLAAAALGLTAVRVLQRADEALAMGVQEIREHSARLGRIEKQAEEAAREQRSYYKATGKALAIATLNFGRLVENTDNRLEGLTGDARRVLRSADVAIQAGARATDEAGADVHALRMAAVKELETTGGELRTTLMAGREEITAIQQVRAPLARTAEGLAATAGNLAESTETVKIALAPLRKAEGRFKWVLKFFLGMLKINVGR